jgi:hypothetical protein
MHYLLIQQVSVLIDNISLILLLFFNIPVYIYMCMCECVVYSIFKLNIQLKIGLYIRIFLRNKKKRTHLNHTQYDIYVFGPKWLLSEKKICVGLSSLSMSVLHHYIRW